MTVSLKKIMADLSAGRRAKLEVRAAELISGEKAARAKRKVSGPRYRYEVIPDASGEWRWRLVAANGKIIANSGEGFRTMQGCLAAIERVRSAASAEVALES